MNSAPSMKKRRATNEEIIAAYKDTGSVWRAGERLGMAGQTVHKRLTGLGIKVGNRWTEDDVQRLIELAETHTINGLGEALGRSYAGIACKLNELGITPAKHNRKKPRRKQDADIKRETAGHIEAIENQTGHVTTYCRQQGIRIETFVQRAERYFPEWWKAYRETHSELDPTTCKGCDAEFTPFSAKQQFCTRKCRNDHNTNMSYFGGNRDAALGFHQKRCVLCHEEKPAMSVHHTLGKENDPNNEGLVLLCSGCHQIVGHLGGRSYSEEDWCNLVMLATIRRYGAEVAANPALRLNVHVEARWVELSEQDLAEEAEELEELEKEGLDAVFHHEDHARSCNLIEPPRRDVAA